MAAPHHVSAIRQAVAHRRALGPAALYLLLVVGAVVVLLPYVWMVGASFKSDAEIFQPGLYPFPSRLRANNYVEVWLSYPVGQWLVNTFIVAIIEVTSTVVTAVLAGFAFARLRWWGRDTLFVVYLAAMMVPIQVTLIPNFIIIRSLGLLNSYLGIASLHLVQFFGIFLMRQFLLNVPGELEDAARIDGCSWLRVLSQIILPIAAPAVVALAIFAFAGTWNDFLWPLVVIDRQSIMTIQVGLAAMKGDVIPWGQLLAATTISAIPLSILYVVLQRFFTQGIVLTGMKG